MGTGLTLRIKALGPIVIRVDGQGIERDIPDKAALLLVYLADQQAPVSRSRLAGLLWSDVGEDRARGNLRVLLSRIRAHVGDHLQTSRDTIWLSPELDYDVARVATGDPDDVLAHYNGDFLSGAAVSGAELFQDWADQRRQSLRTTAMLTLSEAADEAEVAGDWVTCQRMAQRIVDIERWNEAAHRQLIAALAVTAGRAAAMAQYQRCVEALADEMGLEPDAETVGLAERINRTEGAERADGADRADRDRSQHEIEADVVSAPVSGKIPVNLTPFLGRDEELALLTDRLASGSYRLLSVVGPGGVGKTRLAAEAARATAAAHPDGVVFARLAPIRSVDELASLLVDLVAHDVAQSMSNPVDIVAKVIGDRRMCLVLDNFEQLVREASDLIVDILQRCGGLKVLTTSRQPLDLAGEDVFTLTGLATPDEDDPEIGQWPAVRLFVDRAYRVDKTFSLANEDPVEVARLCRLVEGMPLHLELTAARVGTMTLSELNNHVAEAVELPGLAPRDAPDRHASFDAIFAQSWETLSPQHQRALAMLSVTRGGFDQAAAGHILGTDGGEAAHLAHKSLLAQERHGRFRFHELLRQSARARLSESDHDQARVRHATWYLGLVAEATDPIRSSESASVSARLLRDLNNIRSAWTAAVAHGLTDLLGDAAIGLDNLMQLAGRQGEAAELLALAAEAIREGTLEPSGDVDEAFFLRVQSSQWGMIGADTICEISDRVNHLLADRPDRALDRAWAMLNRAHAYRLTTRIDEMRSAIAEVERLAETVDDPELAGWTLSTRGSLLSAEGRFDEAIDYLQRSLAIFERDDDLRGQAGCHGHLAPAFAEQYLVWPALEADLKALELSTLLGNRQRLGLRNVNLACSYILLGDFESARRHAADAINICRANNDDNMLSYAILVHAESLVGLGLVDEGERDFVDGIAMARRLGFHIGLVQSLVPWIRLLQATGRHDQAMLAADELAEIAKSRSSEHYVLTSRMLLARSLAAVGRLDEAKVLADEVCPMLDSDAPPRLPWPIHTRIDLTVVLRAIGDDRVAAVLDAASAIHRSTALSISDPVQRAHYLERLPVSLELAALQANLPTLEVAKARRSSVTA